MAAPNTQVIGRFAPSPTGRMHAGNIYAAMLTWLIVKSQGGKIVLRIEDLDKDRSKQCFIDALMRDFETLGLTWDMGPYFQHSREEAYLEAFSTLEQKGLCYSCFCSRADLHAASAPHFGEKLVYPGTCRNLSVQERQAKALKKSPATRLIISDANYEFLDLIQGSYSQNLAKDCGDFIVRRSDKAFAYQLAVVVDDAEQGVNLVSRGVDLLCSTPQQMYLQDLLSCEHPRYAHFPLLVSEQARRLSKRDKDASLEALMSVCAGPEGVLGHIAYIVGLTEAEEPLSMNNLLKRFSLESYVQALPDKTQLIWR